MIKISVRFENNSRHISTTGVHKFRATLFCTETPNACACSLWNILAVNVPVERNLGGVYTSVKFTLFGIEQKVNDSITIRLCC